jgi:hypothetical protein
MALLLVPCLWGKVTQDLEISTCREILVQVGQLQLRIDIRPMGFISLQLAEMEASLSPAMTHTSFERHTRAQLGVIPTARGVARVQGQINAVPDMAPISTPLQPVLMVQNGLQVLAMKGVYIYRITLVWIGLTQMSVEPTLDQRSAQTAQLGLHQIQMETCIEIPDLVGLRLPLQVCQHQQVGPAWLAIQHVQKWLFTPMAGRSIRH